MENEPGFHNIQPDQKCRIITLQLAVPADVDMDDIHDEISSMLSGAVSSNQSNILDWRYPTEYMPEVTASHEPVDGEIFIGFDVQIGAKP
jgi:hypothetical protein